MKNLKKLSRKELKDVKGGQSCVLYVQGSNGAWVPRTGVCKKVVSFTQVGDVSIPSTSSYCETGLGQVPLSSNGGQSRC